MQLRNKNRVNPAEKSAKSNADSLFDMESSLAAEEEDDYALIEHQLQKQRKLEA